LQGQGKAALGGELGNTMATYPDVKEEVFRGGPQFRTRIKGGKLSKDERRWGKIGTRTGGRQLVDPGPAVSGGDFSQGKGAKTFAKNSQKKKGEGRGPLLGIRKVLERRSERRLLVYGMMGA